MATFDAHQNFAYSTVATAPSPATTGTTVTLQTGDGANFPDPATAGQYNVTIWPTSAQPSSLNAEIARVTGKSGDTLTLIRAQEGSTARSVVVGDQIAATVTKKTLTDIESAIASAGGDVLFDQTLSADGLSLDTGANGIPSGYAALLVICYIRVAQAAQNASVDIQFNGDTTAANYAVSRMLDANTSLSESVLSGAVLGQVPADSNTANLFGVIEALIPNYDNTTGMKAGRSHASSVGGTAANDTQSLYGWYWNGTAAINRIAVVNDAAGVNIKAGSRVVIIGLGKKAQTPASVSTGVGARAKVAAASAPSIPNATWTAVPMDATDWDTGGLHSNGTNNTRITVPQAGKYTVDAAAIFSNNSSGVRYLGIAVNGTRKLNLPLSDSPSGNATNQALSTSDTVDLKAGDYVELHVYQDSGVALTIVAGSAFLAVTLAAPILAQANADGWIDDSTETWTYASASSFTVPGDLHTKYAPGTRIKLMQSGVVSYFVVASSSYNSGTNTTTVTITGGSDYTLANSAITGNKHSYAANPQGWPDWFNFAPATAGVTGAGGVARFKVTGREVTIAFEITGTSNATTKSITLPITPANITGLQWVGHLTVEDNGASLTTPGEIVVNPNNASASIYKDTQADGWTASGSWFAIGVCHYEI